MRRRRTRPLICLFLCLPLAAASAAVFAALPKGSLLNTAAAAGSFLTDPKNAAIAAAQIFSIEAGTAEPETEGGGFWIEIPSDQLNENDTASEEAVVPQEGAGAVVDAVYTGQLDDVTCACGAGLVKNCTDLPLSEVSQALSAQLPFVLEKNCTDPQVLVVHTHATECYQSTDTDWYDPAEPTRSTDTSRNMVAVGAVLAETLNQAGIVTLHDSTLHDYPSYNGSYERSLVTVQQYLEQYPTIKVVLDIHRDAIEKSDGTRMRPVIELNGERYAQLMIICAADDGTRGVPNFKQNLRFAGELQNALASISPTLARPVLFDYRNYNYNQQLSTGSLLVEVGDHANTLEQAQRSARLLGQALASLAQ